MAVVLVGAMIVASIDTVWAGQISPSKKAVSAVDYQDHLPSVQIARGEEMGRFKLGSTAIIVFGPGMAMLQDGLCAGQPVQMGQALGEVANAT
jgi:phosphatidylserine decarboxylase